MSDGPTMPPPSQPPGPSEEGPQPKPWWKRWYTITGAVVVLLLVIAGIAGGGEDDESSDSDSTTPATEAPVETDPTTETTEAPAETEPPQTTSAPTTAAPNTTAAPTTTSPPTTTTPPLTVYGPGTLIAPDEIPLGTYRTVGYTALLDNDLEIIDNNLISGDGFGLLVVAEGVPFIEIGDEVAPIEEFGLVDVLAENAAGTITEGIYLAGFDIPPGRYRVEANPGDDNAYAASLALEPNGEFDIIDNELGPSIIIDIPEGAWGFEFRGIITPL